MENSYIKKYKEYISFLRANRDDLLKNDNWDMIDEYKGYDNHLIYDCSLGFLPPLNEVETVLHE